MRADTVSRGNRITDKKIRTPCPREPCYQYGAVSPNELMKENIKALLRLRQKTPEDLARYLRSSEDWVKKVFREPRRTFPITHYESMAKWFGVEVYQLLQPGIAERSERRTRERRKVLDRRVSQAVISEKALDVDIVHVVRALSHEGRREAIGVLMDILNDELQHARTTRPAPDAADRTPETPPAMPTRRRKKLPR